MFGVPLVFLRPFVSDSHLFVVSHLMLPFPALFGSTVATCYVSLQRPGNFTHFLREGGPQFLILRSILTGWFCWLRRTSCCVSFGRPVLSGTMVGMDQKDSFYVHMRLFDEARGDSTGAVLGQGDMPVVVASGAMARQR